MKTAGWDINKGKPMTRPTKLERINPLITDLCLALGTHIFYRAGAYWASDGDIQLTYKIEDGRPISDIRNAEIAVKILTQLKQRVDEQNEKTLEQRLDDLKKLMDETEYRSGYFVNCGASVEDHGIIYCDWRGANISLSIKGFPTVRIHDFKGTKEEATAQAFKKFRETLVTGKTTA